MEIDLKLTRALELDAIKEIDIVQFLEYRGFKVTCRSYKITWFLNHLRGEKEASLAIYHNKRPMDWYDYGIRKGGSIIDLVMMLDGCSYVNAVQLLRKQLGLNYEVR